MAARYVVRYGSMRYLGEFGARDLNRETDLKRGDQVVIRSHRGTEFGEVLSEATERTRELLGRTDSTGKILRLVTPEDDQSREKGWQQAEEFFRQAKETIAEHKLPMQLVDVETLLGGEKAIFFYTSEDRVDFRELVRALAKQFKTRIEMRQIGIRDEAKLLSDYGDCGKPVCCNTHLDKMPRVSMKMAKVQKASLDPNKISGRCGRLKCCLRYEYDTYVEHQKELPKQGKWIETENGVGKVLSQEILARKLLVAFEDGRRVIVDAADVKGIVPAPERTQQPRSRGPERKAPASAPSSSPTTPDQQSEDQKSGNRKGRRRRKPKNRNAPSTSAEASSIEAINADSPRGDEKPPSATGETAAGDPPKRKRRRRRRPRRGGGESTGESSAPSTDS